MKNIITTLALCAISVLPMTGVTRQQAASQYQAYPDSVLPALTPAPQGYKPFHIEHYGRHGSRWLTGSKDYDIPVEELTKAERNGALTPRGKQVLEELRTIQADSRGRIGELTPLGADQHKHIARRMGLNFPEVFAPGTHVDARSTVVIRCILSMLNEVEQLAALYPTLNITTDASERDMWYMNHHDPDRNAIVDSVKKAQLPAFEAARTGNYRWIDQLVSDPQFAADSLNMPRLNNALFDVALNIQSHGEKYPPLLWIFSDDDVQKGWEKNNVHWFLDGANSALTRGRGAMAQRFLLRNILASADTAMTSPGTSANLRFGHETMVFSLAVLLDLADYGVEINNLDEVATRWRGYEIFPMACNIQMVFYRPEGSTNPDDVLVKILLNEREMPVRYATPVSGPYYRWTDIRNTLLQRMDAYDTTL